MPFAQLKTNFKFLFFVEECKMAAYVKGTIGKGAEVILDRSDAFSMC
jgi:hypothetical protein